MKTIREIFDEILPLLYEIWKNGKSDADLIQNNCKKIFPLLKEIQKLGEPYGEFVKQFDCDTYPSSVSNDGMREFEARNFLREIFKWLFQLKNMCEPDAEKIDQLYISLCMGIEDFMNATKLEDEERAFDDQETQERRRINKLFKKGPEQTVLRVFHECIDTNTTLYRDMFGYTLLHKAVQKKYLKVAELFLDHGVSPLAYAMGKITPLHIAFHNGSDEMTALIVSKLPIFVVRRIFGDSNAIQGRFETHDMDQIAPEEANDNRNEDIELSGTYDIHTVKPLFKIKQMISKELDKTVLQILNSCIEEERYSEDSIRIHVKLLATDDEGREPGDTYFNRNHRNVFQTLACHNKKVILPDTLNHPVIRLYVDNQWEVWCQKLFLDKLRMYLFGLFCLTFSAVTGATASDVHTYDTPLQYSRAVMEFASYLYALAGLIYGIRQMLRQKRSYFADFFNNMELFSAIFMIAVLPMRYIHVRAHWYVFALGYFLWAIRIFKYGFVFSQTSVYAEVIKRILAEDFVRFSILMLVINMIFSGTFLLILKADDSLYTHNATSSFQDIVYFGVRTLIEAGPIVDYTGSDGYRVAGTIVMLVYMFFTTVVMLNILIAQLSETYGRIQDECITHVQANRIRTIEQEMRNSSWTKFYDDYFVGFEPKEVKKDPSDLDLLSNKIEAMRKEQINIGLEVHTVKETMRKEQINIGLEVQTVKETMRKEQINIGLEVQTVKAKLDDLKTMLDDLKCSVDSVQTSFKVYEVCPKNTRKSF